MGSGHSYQIDRQEEFVKRNYAQFEKVLNNDPYTCKDFKYTRGQIQGKLRQLYHKSDDADYNSNSYILDCNWKKAKSKVDIIR